MSHSLPFLNRFLLMLLLSCAGMASGYSGEISLLEREPEGWMNLLDDPSLSDWERVSPGSKFPLAEKSPWKLEDGVLHCEAAGIYELLLTCRVFGDGVLHVEWRYVGEPERPDSGILLRASADGGEWYQAQLATPGLGSFSTKGYNKAKVSLRRPDLQRPAGEWNVMEVTCREAELSLWINGENVSVLPDCAVTEGRIGLQAEFVPIEFRNVKFKPGKE